MNVFITSSNLPYEQIIYFNAHKILIVNEDERMFYSFLNAFIGSNFDALYAGYKAEIKDVKIPKKIPITI